MPQGKVILITGASTGLGRAAAELLAGRGYRVFGTSRKPAEAPLPYEMLLLDVRCDESVRACVEEVVRRAGRIDVLVNNAGYSLDSLVEEASSQQVRDLFETNFLGAVRMVKAVLPIMRRQRAGRIINVSSMAGRMGLPGQAYYCASKFALEGFSESLSIEMEQFGIDVCLMEPGFFRTDIVRNAVAVRPLLPEYDPLRQALRTSLLIGMHCAAPLEVFAQRLLRVIEKARPRLRYPVGKGMTSSNLAWALLPTRAFRAMMRLWFYVNRWRFRSYLQQARQAEAQRQEPDHAH
jgi:NAD(P)-dependent dehydrogenase (short-subunit alcohol dehydrogenase family)